MTGSHIVYSYERPGITQQSSPGYKYGNFLNSLTSRAEEEGQVQDYEEQVFIWFSVCPISVDYTPASLSCPGRS